MTTTRRAVLGLLSLLAPGAAVLASGGGSAGAAAGKRVKMLRTLGAGQSAAVILGEGYLRTLSGDAATLGREARISALGQCLDRKLCLAGDLPMTDEAILDRYRACLRDDFAAGRTADVQGWVLAQTECEVYALAALTA